MDQAFSTEAPREWTFTGSDEVFRSIYTRAGTGFGREVIAVCSAIDGEGKTTVAMGLAIALAQDFPSRRVLLVETDLQRPVLADDFATEAAPGLVDCLVYGAPLQDACRGTFLDNLHIVPAGQPISVSGRPLRSSQMAAVVDHMREMYDVVILDVPAVLSNSDAALLTDLADGVVWVVRAGVTAQPLVSRGLEQIEEMKVRGMVLNGTRSSAPNWLRRIIGI
jgi:capsular exopolysaccharide synthesis family protein